MNLKDLIRTIPDFPKKGIMFRDITTLLSDSEGFKNSIDQLIERYKNVDFDVVIGIEARGFVFGAALAYGLGKGFVPLRKKGKLPGRTVSVEYELEYGTDALEVHEDAIKKGSKVILIDDLLATGGTALAAVELLQKLESELTEFAVIVDLPELGGKKKLEDCGLKVFTLCEFEGH